MERYVWLYVVAGIIVAVAVLLPVGKRSQNANAKKREYNFARRDYIMTRSEAKLFRRLELIAGDRYYIFPQVHLSSILDHKMMGQNWRGALSTIQRKSVDFALVDKTSLKTMYILELDDITHDRPDRQERDAIVAQLLMDADMPLVRLRNVDKLSDADIEIAFREANARKEHATI